MYELWKNGGGFGCFLGGGQRGWAEEGQSCKQAHTSQLQDGDLVNLDTM